VIPAPPPGAPLDLPARPDLPEPVTGRRNVTWRWPEAIAIYLVGYLAIASILVGAVIYAVAGVDDPDEISGVVEVVATFLVDLVFVAVMVAWLTKRHPGWLGALGVPPRGERLRVLAWGAGMGLLLYPAIAIVVGVPLSFLMELLSGERAVTPEQVPSDLSGAGTVLMVVLAVLVAPVMEELFYRGVLFRSIRDRYGFWVGAVVSGLLFGVAHYVPAPWQDAVLLQSVMVFTGLGLAWIYERRGTILAPIAAHMVFNIIGVAIILGTT
jgi:membrane protease YdiL (CAAX protease family)